MRAFDVRTGREVWRFHTVPRPGEFGHETWADGAWERRTGVNVWSSMSVDEARGLVFLPVGSASYDFYGADRKGSPLFANSLVALDARTGARRWHFQLVHHDLWDYDPPAQPILADITRNGSTVPAVIQLTKMGLVFVFNRETGEPVFGVEERPVPPSVDRRRVSRADAAVPAEAAAAGAESTPVTRADLTTRHRRLASGVRRRSSTVLTSGGIYTPPGPTLTLSFPGTLGGATWSGGSVNPALQYLFVNTNDVGAVGRMAPAPPGLPLAFRRESDSGAYAPILGLATAAVSGAAMGPAARDRSRHRRYRVAGAARRRAAAGRARDHRHGHAEPRRLGRDGRRPRVHRRRERSPIPRVRREDRARASGTPSCRRAGTRRRSSIARRRAGTEIVVIAAGGGGRFSSAVSDAIVAFALGQ